MNHQLDRLFSILSSESFLTMQGLVNGIPIYVQPYNVRDEDHVAAMIRALAQRLRTSGIKVAEVNLFQLLLDELGADDLLEGLIDGEIDHQRKDLLETLKNYAEPKSHIVPRLGAIMAEEGVRLTLVSGVGHIYPFLRAHKLLNTVEQGTLPHPMVMFFPGEYILIPGQGSQLRLFGSQPAKGYYRAFNLDHYRLAPK